MFYFHAWQVTQQFSIKPFATIKQLGQERKYKGSTRYRGGSLCKVSALSDRVIGMLPHWYTFEYINIKRFLYFTQVGNAAFRAHW